MKKQVKFILKLVFGITILVILLSKTSIQEFMHMLLGAKYKYFALSLILYILGQIISAEKWMVLSERLNFNNSFFQYTKWYFLGMFYNMFLPTNIGGDIVKIAKLNDKKNNGLKRAAISVFSDRIIGVSVLFILILFGLFFYNSFTVLIMANIGVIIFLCAILLFFYIYKNKNIISDKFKTIFNLIFSLCERKLLIKVIILSLIFHFVLIFIHYFIAQMYNLSIPFFYYLLLYPITAIVASLPLSINGMGLKEFVYVFMLKMFNISISEAILYAVTFNMVILFSSILGFIPFLTDDKVFSAEENSGIEKIKK